MNRELISYVFRRPEYINISYMDNMILISDVIIGGGTFDIVIYHDGGIGVYEDFSEIVDGKIAGGLLADDLLADEYYGLVVHTGQTLLPPEWEIIDWMLFASNADSLRFKTEDYKWYTINAETNWKPVSDNE